MSRDFVPYPAIEHHGVIGDRRTAALVAADGTISWWCLPNYDGAPVFGALIDSGRGGFWRIGPVDPELGRQRYLDRTAILLTGWEGGLEVTDAMLWPEDGRGVADENRRVIIRRVRCTSGATNCVMALRPRVDFRHDSSVSPVDGGLIFDVGEGTLGLWASVPVTTAPHGAGAELNLAEEEEAWFVLGPGENPADWSPERARAALQAAAEYWVNWDRQLAYTGPRQEHVRRSALTIHLLSFAPSGALVAAPTTSLPERIGGDWNADYRFAWVRDASLTLAILAMLGQVDSARQYMDWLVGLGSSTAMPLQVLYRIDGGTDADQVARDDLDGYRQSRPVLIGNHACKQTQHDALGYLADCALIYLEHSGAWKPEYSDLIVRLADYTIAHWREPDNGIWELDRKQHHVSSKVMAWVTLERACKIIARIGDEIDTARWRTTMDDIRGDVLRHGWSDHLQGFRQRYESDRALDSAALLIPLMQFLPATDSRVSATVDAVAAELTRGSFAYRFNPKLLPDGQTKPPLGEFEGAFLPCTFWLAAAYAMRGEPERGEAILDAAEGLAGPLGLFAEGVEPRSKTFLGNTPLLFSHAEYLRAVFEIAKARPLQKAAMMVGQAAARVERLVKGNS